VQAGVNQRASAPKEFWEKLKNGIPLMVVLPGVSETAFRSALQGHLSVQEWGTISNEAGGGVDTYTKIIPPPWSHYDANTDSYVIYILRLFLFSK
jgi:hypothetical protein